MPQQNPVKIRKLSADWLLRGALTKIGDSFDRLTGRRWVPSSSLAASELTERIKRLLDAEAKEVAGKGFVVPHNIQLKMQWNKFAEGDAIDTLQTELLTAAIDHINDSLYYTESPVTFEIKPDYFIEGVKLYVSFNTFVDEDIDGGQNITIPAINVSEINAPIKSAPTPDSPAFIASYEISGKAKQTTLHFPPSERRSVGRTAASDLVLDDASISKIHASLMAGNVGVLSVADTGSTNGTFINNTRIAYGKAIRLADGDRVKFGEIEVKFEPVINEQTSESDASATVPNFEADDAVKGEP